MLTRLKRRLTSSRGVAIALFCGTAITLAVTTATIARPSASSEDPIVFINVPHAQSQSRPPALAVERFVSGMARHDADIVWMFASEEEQDAFGTEREAYAAYADAFPEFAKARDVTFTRFWREGDTDFVQALIGDRAGVGKVATMGFWLDDAGDWKLVSCDVQPVSDLLAGL